MSNLIIFVIAFLLNNALWVFIILYLRGKDDKREVSYFREFVRANKAKDLAEYNLATPEENQELPEEDNDEVVDLDQVDPNVLLKAIRQQQNENK